MLMHFVNLIIPTFSLDVNSTMKIFVFASVHFHPISNILACLTFLRVIKMTSPNLIQENVQNTSSPGLSAGENMIIHLPKCFYFQEGFGSC